MKTMMLARIPGTTELLDSRGGLAREKNRDIKNAGFKAKNATVPVYPLLGFPESGTVPQTPGSGTKAPSAPPPPPPARAVRRLKGRKSKRNLEVRTGSESKDRGGTLRQTGPRLGAVGVLPCELQGGWCSSPSGFFWCSFWCPLVFFSGVVRLAVGKFKKKRGGAGARNPQHAPGWFFASRPTGRGATDVQPKIGGLGVSSLKGLTHNTTRMHCPRLWRYGAFALP